MLGLLVIAVLLVYLAVSFIVIKYSVLFVRCHFGNGWIGGVLAAFVMYNLVFWDAIPIWYTHYSLCAKEAGLMVYQTPEEWVNENPGRYLEVRASAGWVPIIRSENTPAATHQWVEFALGLEYESYRQWDQGYAFRTGLSRKRVIDKVTGKVMFEVVDFSSSAGKGSIASGANNFSDYKFWTDTGLCQRAYPGVMDKFKHHGRTFDDLIKVMDGWKR